MKEKNIFPFITMCAFKRNRKGMKLKMKEMKIKVNGMVCEGCENRVKNALSTLDGVERVEASYETGIVTVISNKEIEKSVIEEKIEDIGFETVKGE